MARGKKAENRNSPTRRVGGRKSMIRRVYGGTRGPWVTVGEDRFIYYRRQGREGAAEQIAAPGERKRCAKDDRKRENDRQTQGTRGDRKSPKKRTVEKEIRKKEM